MGETEVEALRREVAQLRSALEAQDRQPHGCTACRGSGTVVRERWVPFEGMVPYHANCPSCNGRGSIVPAPKCSYPPLRQGSPR